MMTNILIIALAAVVPTVTGFIWYNPKVFGNAWMKAAEMTDEKIKGANMLVILGISVVLSFLLAFSIQYLAIHQLSMYSILLNEPGFGDPNSEVMIYLDDFMKKYGTNFRTFKHGALHGTLAGFTIALPILATNALFERKGFKYIAINGGYWIVTMAIMGGIICQFA